jgi:glycosyltransferase involved in cell wall biosynthesis
MRILQVTTIVSHHQLPLARELASLVGMENFRFAATEPPDHEREELGWNSQVNESWIFRAGERKEDREKFEQWWDEADVVICNVRRCKRIQDRLDKGKLTFYTSERRFKQPIGMARLLHPRFALMTSQFLKLASSPLFHYLPIGLFAYNDMSRIAKFQNRAWLWGYFTELPKSLSTCERVGNELRLLWAGRMMACKRLDTLIRAFSQLQHKCDAVTLTLIGDGSERVRLEKLASKLLIAGSYKFLPPVAASQVLELMQQHHVYVLPSNGYEGWGAVINEAMSAGCAIVASEGAGAAKTMIKHQYNGLLFQPGDWRILSEHLYLLASNETIRQQLIKQGWYTITNQWSPAVAAERFFTVSEAIMSKRPVPTFDNGPMVLLNAAAIN